MSEEKRRPGMNLYMLRFGGRKEGWEEEEEKVVGSVWVGWGGEGSSS